MADYWHIFVDVWRLMKRFLTNPENSTRYFDRLFEEVNKINEKYPENTEFVFALCSAVVEQLKKIVEG